MPELSAPSVVHVVDGQAIALPVDVRAAAAQASGNLDVVFATSAGSLSLLNHPAPLMPASVAIERGLLGAVDLQLERPANDGKVFGGVEGLLAQFDPTGAQDALQPLNAVNVAAGLTASTLTQSWQNLGLSSAPQGGATLPSTNSLKAFANTSGAVIDRNAFMSFQLTPSQNKVLRLDEVSLSTR